MKNRSMLSILDWINVLTALGIMSLSTICRLSLYLAANAAKESASRKLVPDAINSELNLESDTLAISTAVSNLVFPASLVAPGS